MNQPAWPGSPVTEVLATILNATLPGKVAIKDPRPGMDCLILSYHDDFESLWRVNDRQSDITTWINSAGLNPRTIVIVWDRIPTSKDTTINTADYVTPFDWALVCSKVVLSNRATVPHAVGHAPKIDVPRLRIVILDLNSQEHSGAFAYHAFMAVGQSLPWVQVYRPTQEIRPELEALRAVGDEAIAQLRSAVVTGSFGIEMLLEDVKSYHTSAGAARSLSLHAAQAERDRTQVVESLTGLWQSSLVRPGDRHHVGNLLAPMLLAKGLPPQLRAKVEASILQADPLRSALKVLVEVIGLEGSRGGGSAVVGPSGLLESLRAESDIFDRRSGVNVLLVDDQFRLGYQHVLSTLLFSQRYEPSQAHESGLSWSFELPGVGAVRCEGTAEPIFRALESVPPINDWFEPRLFPVSPWADVLILDLRLWTRPEERRAFLSRLVGICKNIGAVGGVGGGTPMSDPAFKGAFEQAEALVADSVQGQSEIEALVLLPLLLSHFDPSLPIILFSSTHQRAIIQMVAHRRNIITEFAKPILSGYGEERETAELVDDLVRALRRAIKMHEVRGLWGRLLTLSWRIKPVFECFTGQRVYGEKLLKVYNVPPSAAVNAQPPWQREAAGQAPPRLDGRNLRVLLAKHFVSYIQSGRHFDFASIPWEILEGNLVPKKVLKDPNIFNPDFGMQPNLVKPPELRNNVIRALEIIRHKKAHGNAPPVATEMEAEDYRFGAVLQFSMLLDFIEGASAPAKHLGPNVEQLWRRIRSRYKYLGRVERPPEANRLTADVGVSWLDFMAYTTLSYAAKTVENGVMFLSANTVMQIERLAQYAIKRT